MELYAGSWILDRKNRVWVSIRILDWVSCDEGSLVGLGTLGFVTTFGYPSSSSRDSGIYPPFPTPLQAVSLVWGGGCLGVNI
jgi:hypothetical protein